ncbi:hypothetical protein Tco_0765014 [Tanacetum coccineum]
MSATSYNELLRRWARLGPIRVTDAIKAIAIYETKIPMTHIHDQVITTRNHDRKRSLTSREVENQPKDNRVPQQLPFKKPDVERAYTVGANRKKAYSENLPYCNKMEALGEAMEVDNG